ncbi:MULTISPECIES: hypothetical protein [Mycolicibacterium]|jgi:hypothetical protein|uniref:Keratin associated protein n=2 Tax=Mycolicibacterium fortuitum TaxID=1766 RepID=A0A0N9Y712_MYCFO|nr:hypothetical protein [Mycolicibacterium fortuitum]ALI25169.1 hypothetical protein XA26_13170 [Mycolicibacterium fortuitum]MCA4756413.1 hypothetical protein [Mycolicibacterium fortuitum]MCV7144113.1 hypothetical protein [Mycolicibacterium fortuitum]MDV7188865.1 hypothetical protein [Mycolicibacterium fortuitum]MDV7203341.1 hypothetical protein [Mycolicibacterium fortuitum]
MSNTFRGLAALPAVLALAILTAPLGSAAPRCTTTSPHTTQCQTNGSTAIVTSPPALNTGPWYGPVFGFGGMGVGW